jgi:aminopeptidase N
VHDHSHQRVGNAVTLPVWPDIWPNEAFARFSQWLYTERHGGLSAQQSFLNAYNPRSAASIFWTRPPAALPGPALLFYSSGYDRGGMTLQALREKIGDDAFFPMMQAWYEENKYRNVTTEQFIAHAERFAGEDLSTFFDVWLYQPVKPTVW